MEKELVLCPELIARGQVTREQLTNLIYKAATACNLDPIEKLRFYRELEKAAGDAVKLKDPDYDKSIDRAAADFAEHWKWYKKHSPRTRRSSSTRTAAISTRKIRRLSTCLIQTTHVVRVSAQGFLIVVEG